MKKYLILFCLTMILILQGCGTNKQIIQNTQIQKVKIPAEILTLEKLDKPLIKNEIDIIKAYTTLFYHYKQCEIKIETIKELNEK